MTAKQDLMRRLYAAALVVAAITSTGCAGSGTTAGGARPVYDDCLFAATLRDWRPLNDQNLILFAAGRRPYHVELVRPAFGFTFDVMIGVYDRDDMICPYGGDAIVIDGPMPDRIAIRSIKRLSDEELDEVYVRFGIRAPAVIETTEGDPREPDAQ
jgi:hypothetical protein